MSLPFSRLPDAWALPENGLADRVVLVTGASGGLGSAVALACAHAGATVVLAGKRVRALEKVYDQLVAADAAQPAIVPLNLESATPGTFAEVASTITSELGRLDGLVHAAAHFDALTPLDQHKPDEWLRTLQVNLSAPFALTQACMPLLQAAPDSSVVFVTDDPERLQRAHWGAYGVAKAGLERMAAIAHDENDSGAVRIHSVLPAPMRTALRRMAWFGENTMQQPTPEVTAQAVVYLLSAAAAPLRGTLLDLRPEARNPAPVPQSPIPRP